MDRDPNQYPPSIDETPLYIDSPDDGTTSIEHSVRRLVTCLARLQSVTVSNEKWLSLKVYVRLDTKEWLRVYARLYYASELTSCMHLPDLVTLAAATLINDVDLDDLTGEHEEDVKTAAIGSVRNIRNGLGLGGRPKAAPARAEVTVPAMDFNLMATNQSTRNSITINDSLRNKGWSEKRKFGPSYDGDYSCQRTRNALLDAVPEVRSVSESHRATATIHVHLTMQSVVLGAINWPLSDTAGGVEIRLRAQELLKSTYVEPIVEMARLTARPPIVNINHDPRVIAVGSLAAKRVEHHTVGYRAMGAYVAFELPVRGCVVIHGSSDGSKVACHLKQSTNMIARTLPETEMKRCQEPMPSTKSSCSPRKW